MQGNLNFEGSLGMLGFGEVPAWSKICPSCALALALPFQKRKRNEETAQDFDDVRSGLDLGRLQ